MNAKTRADLTGPWKPTEFHLSPVEAKNILRLAGVDLEGMTQTDLTDRVVKTHRTVNTIIRLMIFQAKRA